MADTPAVPSVYPASAAVPGPSSRPPAEPLRLTWSQPAGLVGLSIKIFLLRLMTLGIYGFWGKTEVRRRIWTAIRLNGEPLEYTGTGKELLLGFLLVFGIIMLPVLLLSLGMGVAFRPDSPVLVAYQLLLYAAFFLLIGVGTYRATRYRLARTQWRGIRAGLDGSSWSYGWTYFWTGLLVPLTLGWIAPWRTTRLQGLVTNNMRFGTRPLQFDASPGPLYGRFAILWVGGLVIMLITFAAIGALMQVLGIDWERMMRTGSPRPSDIPKLVLAIYGTLFVGFLLYGVLSAYYRAAMMNHFAAHTTFEGARFRGSATGGSLIWLTVTNSLLALLSLGLLIPIVLTRSAGYMVQRLAIEGEVPLGAIMQGSADPSVRGEGLAQAFDVDAF